MVVHAHQHQLTLHQVLLEILIILLQLHVDMNAVRAMDQIVHQLDVSNCRHALAQYLMEYLALLGLSMLKPCIAHTMILVSINVIPVLQ